MAMMNSGITTFYRSIYSIVDQAEKHGLVIYGAGFWGERSLEIFSLFNIKPAYFCDDNPEKQGTFFRFRDLLIPIVPLEKAAEELPNAVYFAAATHGRWQNSPRGRMNARLRDLGLLSEYSGFHPSRYLFLLEGGMDALCNPQPMAQEAFGIDDINNLIILNHMGNSGIVYFNTLLDGHPNIINIQVLGRER